MQTFSDINYIIAAVKNIQWVYVKRDFCSWKLALSIGGIVLPICIYTSFYHKLDATQHQFLSRVELVWIQSFPSPRQVAISRLKSPVCSIISTDLGGKRGIQSFLWVYWCKVKCKKCHPGFEFRSLSLFLIIITAVLCTTGIYIYIYIYIYIWVWVSLGASFMWPCATSQQKA